MHRRSRRYALHAIVLLATAIVGYLGAVEARAWQRYFRAKRNLALLKQIPIGSPASEWLPKFEALGAHYDPRLGCYVRSDDYPNRFDAWPIMWWYESKKVHGRHGLFELLSLIGARVSYSGSEMCIENNRVSFLSFEMFFQTADASWRLVRASASDQMTGRRFAPPLIRNYEVQEGVVTTTGGGISIAAHTGPGATESQRARAFDVNVRCLVRWWGDCELCTAMASAWDDAQNGLRQHSVNPDFADERYGKCNARR